MKMPAQSKLESWKYTQALDRAARQLLDLGAGVDAAYRAAVAELPRTPATRGEETGLFGAAAPQEEV